MFFLVAESLRRPYLLFKAAFPSQRKFISKRRLRLDLSAVTHFVLSFKVSGRCLPNIVIIWKCCGTVVWLCSQVKTRVHRPCNCDPSARRWRLHLHIHLSKLWSIQFNSFNSILFVKYKLLQCTINLWKKVLAFYATQVKHCLSSLGR